MVGERYIENQTTGDDNAEKMSEIFKDIAEMDGNEMTCDYK